MIGRPDIHCYCKEKPGLSPGAATSQWPQLDTSASNFRVFSLSNTQRTTSSPQYPLQSFWVPFKVCHHEPSDTSMLSMMERTISHI